MTDIQDKFTKTLARWVDRREGDRWDLLLSDFWEVLALTIDAVGRLETVQPLRAGLRALDFQVVVDQATEAAGAFDRASSDEAKWAATGQIGDAGVRTASALLRVVETLETQAARIGEQQTAIADLQRQVGTLRTVINALSGQYRTAQEGEADRLDRIARLEGRMTDLERPIEVELTGSTSREQAGRIARGRMPSHPVDAIKEVLAGMGQNLDPRREAALRDICDAPVPVSDRPKGEATYPDGRPMDSGVNGPDGDRYSRTMPARLGSVTEVSRDRDGIVLSVRVPYATLKGIGI